MRLLLIRHAIAEDPDAFAAGGRPDAERPLTERGRRRMQVNARGLARLVPAVDSLVCSPYARAVETARIVAAALEVRGPHALQRTDSLVHDRHPKEFVGWLATLQAETAAAVGHEPHLGRLIAWCATGGTASFVQMKKGGACLLEFEATPAKGRGTVVWLLQPAQLRVLARAAE